MSDPEPRLRRRAACIVCALALGLLAGAAAAQEPKLPKWRIDPYTKNKPEALAKAGYVSFGPFPFGNLGPNEATSTDIEKTLPFLQIHWIETQHFRLGIELPAFTLPEDLETRRKIRRELERLGEKLPGIDPKTRTLDPWLRAHLFAQRVEDIYDEFSKLAGVKDADFPQDPDKLLISSGPYMGQGPFLGMKKKYLLLLFEKEASFLTYMRTYLGRDSHYGQRWHCKDVGCLLYTIATECDEGRFKNNDTALHCNVAFNVSQNLLDGFRHYSYDLPVWIREGLGHWFERRVDGKWNSFDQNEGSPADMKKEARWEPYVRGLLTNGGKYAPFTEAYGWRDFGNITFNDHTTIWSRVDFLMKFGPEKWRTFLFGIKGRVTREWVPDQTDLVGATRDALQQAYGFSALQFDEKWSEWVKATYPSQ